MKRDKWDFEYSAVELAQAALAKGTVDVSRLSFSSLPGLK
jgi:hypothetical protein